METYTATCPTCNEQVSSTFSQGQANRNLGLHRRKAHGYQSPEYEAAKKYRLTVKRKLLAGDQAVVELERKAVKVTAKRREQLRLAREARWGRYPLSKSKAALTRREPHTFSPEQRLKRKQYQDAYRDKMRAARAAMANNNSPDAALPCSLPICPRCGAKFYVVKGQV